MRASRRSIGFLLALALVGGAARAAGPTPGAVIAVPPPVPLAKWNPTTDNLVVLNGRVTLRGSPVSGLRLRVDGWELPAPTGTDGRFSYPVDATRLARHVVSAVDASRASARGAPLDAAARSALAARHAAFTVAYRITGLRAGRDGSGNPTVSGRIAFSDRTAPPMVSLYSYELTGTVTDARGRPVVGARVSTRTQDRDYWTVSPPTDARGHYSSLFTASSAAAGNPVPFTVRVALGDRVYQFLSAEVVMFQRLQSSRLDIRLPPRGYPMALPLPRSYPGAIYEGIVVGASAGGAAVRPIAVTWPDRDGRFTITLPRELAGRDVTLWEADLQLFSRTDARPGGPIDLRDWPRVLSPDAPRDLARVTLR